MTEDVEQITKTPISPPTKDPKKVAAGKKLAAYNKKAKEQRRIADEVVEQKGESWFPETSLTSIIALLGLGLTAIDLFFRYKSQQNTSSREDENQRLESAVVHQPTGPTQMSGME